MDAVSPLRGKKVLIPRDKKQAKPFAELVAQKEGVPVVIPLLAFRPVQDNGELIPVLDNLDDYSWIIFTSNTTVETFFALLPENRNLSANIAAIGEKTAESLSAKNVPVAFVPSEYVAESFVKEFLPRVQQGEKVLIPKGNLARNVIASSLREHGVIADEVTIYETYFPEKSKRRLMEVLEGQELDILCFTSPSTVDHFMSVVNSGGFHDKLSNCIVACIGPIAKRRAEKHGLKVDVMPEIYTVPELIKAVISFLEEYQ